MTDSAHEVSGFLSVLGHRLKFTSGGLLLSLDYLTVAFLKRENLLLLE